ncbi:hypothetical protein [Schlesneria sp. DSM 10557]|uniref:hypothetical protein n=1 Tax=Schlesneria sp. DSM 10557 TaxID=3044399 RepID=UPI0035C8372D
MLAEELPKNAVKVGDTKDASDRKYTVEFEIAGGKTAKVAAGESKVFELQDVTKEFHWYNVAGNERIRERVANDANFNWVKISRAGNGAIEWTFYRAK